MYAPTFLGLYLFVSYQYHHAYLRSDQIAQLAPCLNHYYSLSNYHIISSVPVPFQNLHIHSPVKCQATTILFCTYINTKQPCKPALQLRVDAWLRMHHYSMYQYNHKFQYNNFVMMSFDYMSINHYTTKRRPYLLCLYTPRAFFFLYNDWQNDTVFTKQIQSSTTF